MYETEIAQFAYHSLLLILILSGPPIGTSLLIGFTVAVFQAATQIQEQSLSFTLKLIAVIVTLLFAGGFLAAQIMQFAENIFANFYKWA